MNTYTEEKLNFGLKYRLYPTDAQKNILDQWLGIRRYCWNQLVTWGRAWREKNAYVAMYVYEEQAKGKPKKIIQKVDLPKEKLDKELGHFWCKPYLPYEVTKSFSRKLTELKKETEWMQVIDPRVFAFLTQDYIAAWTKYKEKLKAGTIKKEKAKYFERKSLGNGKISSHKIEFWGEPQYKSKNDKAIFSIDRQYILNFDQQFICFKKIKKSGIDADLKIKMQATDRLYDFDLQERNSTKGTAYTQIINERQHIEQGLPKATPKKVVVKKLPSGRYQLTITVETQTIYPLPTTPNPKDTLTLDFGSGRWLAYADKPIFNGSHYFENSRPLENHLKKIKQIQKGLSRKYRMNKQKDEKWSDVKTANWEKDRIKLAKLHERVANLRTARVYELVNAIVNSPYQTVCTEDFDLKAMMAKEMPKPNEIGFDKNRANIESYFTRLLSDASLFEIIRVLKYKCKWTGKNHLPSPKNSVTFRQCFYCNHIDEEVAIGTMERNCPSCQALLEKGPNSTKLIKRAAYKAYNDKKAKKKQ